MSILRKGNIPPREVVDKDLFFGNLFSLFLCIQGPKQYETKRSTLRYSFILFSTRQGFLLFPFLRVPHSFRNKKIWTIKLNYRKVEPRAAGPIFFLGISENCQLMWFVAKARPVCGWPLMAVVSDRWWLWTELGKEFWNQELFFNWVAQPPTRKPCLSFGALFWFF